MTPIRSKPNNKSCKWVNFDLQTSENQFRKGVTFHVDLKRELDLAAKSRLPVRLTNFTLKRNEYTKADDVLLTSATRIEESASNIPYKARNTPPEHVDVDTIRDINIGTKVNTEAYLHVSSATTNSWKDSGITKTKREMIINGQTTTTRFVIWQNALTDLKVDGTYMLSNVKVSSFRNEVHLSTTADTTVSVAATPIPKIGGVVYEKIALPCKQVSHIEASRLCSKCKGELESTIKKGMLRCVACKGLEMAANVRNSYNANLYFENGGGGFTVTVFPDQVASLISLCDEEQIVDELDLSYLFLNRRDIVVLYNKKYVCTSFEFQ